MRYSGSYTYGVSCCGLGDRERHEEEIVCIGLCISV